jgi:hypothetical protein
VSNTAAIAGTKITPAFGAQNISTTGTLTSGAATVTDLTASGTVDLGTDAIQTAEIQDGQITSAKILDATVATADLADNAVTTAKISDDNVTLPKIVNGGGDEFLTTDGAGNPQYETKAAILGGTAGNGLVWDGANSEIDANLDGVTLGLDGTDQIEVIDGGITSAKIADGTIATADIANDAIDATKIATDAVAADEIAAGAVGTAEIADGSVATIDLANDAVTTVKVADGSVTAAKVEGLASGELIIGVDGTAANNAKVTVSGDASLANTGALTISNDAVNSAKIADGTIATADIANDAIDAAKIATDAVAADEIAAGAVGTDEIADGSIADADVSNTAAIAGTKISPDFGAQNISTTGTLNTGAATVTDLTATGTVDLGTDAIQTAEIQDGQVTSAKIADNNVTLAKIVDGGANQVLTTDASGNPQYENKTIFQTADAGLNDIAALAVTDGNIIVGDGTNWVAESGATARTSLGLGTLATQDAGTVALTGGTIDGTAIGGTTAAAGSFTNLTATGTVDLGTDAIQTAEIQDSQVTSAKIADGTVATADIANDAVDATKIATNAVGTAEIADGSISDADVSNTAAIAGTKINPAFGAQNISTTGTLNTGAATVSGLTVTNLAGSADTYTGDGGINSLIITAGGVFQTSDRRYKENIVPLNSALEQISRVEGVKYNYKADDASQIHFGVIAQDIEKIFPNLVKTNDKGYKSVNYIELVPMLLEAIKEQQSTIDRLHKQLINGDRRVMQTEKALADQGEMLGMQKMLVSSLQQHILQLQQENLSMLKDLNDIKQHLGLDFKSQK